MCRGLHGIHTTWQFHPGLPGLDALDGDAPQSRPTRTYLALAYRVCLFVLPPFSAARLNLSYDDPDTDGWIDHVQWSGHITNKQTTS